MIVSHKHKLIFVRPIKVAGASFELMLSKYLGPKDVVVGKFKFNQGLDEDNFESVEERNAEGFEMNYAAARNHARPVDVRNFVGKDIWDEYKKVTIIRNPWDAMVSFYFWNLKTETKTPSSFKDAIRWNLLGSYPLNKPYMFMGGHRWADYYLKFERLQADTNKLMGDLGIEGSRDDFKLLRTHNKTRPSGLHYSCMYDDDAKNMLQMAYKREVKVFGYEFDRTGARE